MNLTFIYLLSWKRCKVSILSIPNRKTLTIVLTSRWRNQYPIKRLKSTRGSLNTPTTHKGLTIYGAVKAIQNASQMNPTQRIHSGGIGSSIFLYPWLLVTWDL